MTMHVLGWRNKNLLLGISQILLAPWSDKFRLGRSTVLGREWGSLLDKFVSLIQKLQNLPHRRRNPRTL